MIINHFKNRFISYLNEKRDQYQKYTSYTFKNFLQMLIFSVLFCIIGIVLISIKQSDIVNQVLLIYMGVELIILGLILAIFSIIKIISKMSEKIKIFLLILTDILFLVVILPFSIFDFLITKTNFVGLKKYKALYVVYWVINIPIIFILLTFTSFFLNKIMYINLVTVLALAGFLLNWFLMAIEAKVFFLVYIRKYNRNLNKKVRYSDSNEIIKIEDMIKELKIDKEIFQREVYILNFFIIALSTTIFYIFDISIFVESMTDNIQKEMLSAFSIFIAFDRLYSKWESNKKSNKEQC